MPTRTQSAAKRRAHAAQRGPVARNRIKLSTTVAPENFSFLESMVNEGGAGSIADAVDIAIARLRRTENRVRLEAATAKYFDGLSSTSLSEENDLARRLYKASGTVDVDLEP